MPMREDIHPSGFLEALEHLIMVEHDRDGPARIRVGGVRLNELMGAEVRGMPARALFRDEDKARVEGIITRVLAEPAMADLNVIVVAPGGHTRRGVVTLRPLRTRDNMVSRIIGTVAIDGDDVLDPRTKLTILSADVRALRQMKPQLVTSTAHTFAERQTPFTPKPNAKKPHLRLVSSND